MKQRVLFLDIDGVLNNLQGALLRGASIKVDGFTFGDVLNRDAIRRFNYLVREGDFDVVLSSVWRYFPWEPTLTFFAMKGIDTSRFVGRTDRSFRKPDGTDSKRGDEIQKWLDENAPNAQVVILDDDSDMGHLLDRWVGTFTHSGLQHEHVARALELVGDKKQRRRRPRRYFRAVRFADGAEKDFRQAYPQQPLGVKSVEHARKNWEAREASSR